MAEPDKQHPRYDPEKVEGYVLGSLVHAELRAIEEHLSHCEECRRAIDEERLLAAGARRLGRQDLKDRLARRAAEQPRAVIPWPRIVAVAAVLVVVAGIGILRYQSTRDDLSPQASLRDVPAVGESNTQGNKLQPTDGKPSSADENLRATDERSKRKLELVDDRSENELKNAPEVRAGKETSVSGASKDIGKIGRLDAADRLANAAASSAVWIEGTVLSTKNSLAAPAPAAAAENVQQPTVSGQLQKKVARSEVTPTAVQASREFVVTQQPSHTLPSRQQVMNQRRQFQTISTYAQRSGTQLQLTLYPDSLFTPADIGAASVDRIGDDSIIVHLGRHSIGYRLPQSILPQQTRK